MPKEEMTKARKLWVDALRSGKFNQAIGKLKDGTGRCCLGVLCEVYNEHHPDQQVVFDDENVLVNLPIVAIWVGLRTSTGAFRTIENKQSLTELNDEGTSFEEIAAIIENPPCELFIDSPKNPVGEIYG